MSFTIDTYTNPLTIAITLHADFDVENDTALIAQEFDAVAQSLDTCAFLIIDFRAALTHANLNNVMLGPFLAMKDEHPLFNHPKVCEVLFVAISELMEHVVNGLNSATYGNLNVSLFKTVEDAVGYTQAG